MSETDYPDIIIDSDDVTVVRTAETRLTACLAEPDAVLPDSQELVVGTGLNFSPFILVDVDDMGLEWYESIAIKEEA